MSPSRQPTIISAVSGSSESPIVRGMITSTIHVLILVPILFVLMKRHRISKALRFTEFVTKLRRNCLPAAIKLASNGLSRLRIRAGPFDRPRIGNVSQIRTGKSGSRLEFRRTPLSHCHILMAFTYIGRAAGRGAISANNGCNHAIASDRREDGRARRSYP
jgi:hypothetical protein